MIPRPHDTIAAPASPSGSAPRGIVRLSGPDAKPVLDPIFVPVNGPSWDRPRRPSRHAGTLRIARLGEIPSSVWLWPGTRSYTGQPLAEIHTVGSPPVLEAILDELFARGVRPAQAGEFTLRAFLAGRLDLTQAEAVLGVIDADDQRQLDEALRQLAGGVSRLLAPVRSDLLDLLADLEAGLDFVEEDIEFVTQADLARRLRVARESLERLLLQSGERMQSAARRRVVLAGLPNAGKSTLFNALAGRSAALVSSAPGTTRDWLGAELDWSGLAIELVDTAGWEDAARDIAGLAQELRSEQWRRADLILWCSPVDRDDAAARDEGRLRAELDALGRPVVPVRTKSDLAGAPAAEAHIVSRETPLVQTIAGEALSRDVLCVSAPAGLGLEALRSEVARRLSSIGTRSSELLGSTAARCRESLAAAAGSLRRAEEDARAGAGDELVAIALRDTLDHLGRILGTVYTDDVLDRIFSRFCIGK